MKIKEVIKALEVFAPLPLQESYDNAGLQVGLTEGDVSGALLCLDVTEDVVEKAINMGFNLIVSHHPLLFRGLKQISDSDYVQRTVWKAIQNGVSIVSMHTNLDNANGGVNHKIAELLGLQNVEFLAEQRTIKDASGFVEESQLTGGSGIIGELAEPADAEEFVLKVKKTFGVGCCMTNALLGRQIKRVAVCGGAGSFLLSDAVRKGADAFITGEMHYHEYFGQEGVIQIIVIGHYESEQFTCELLRQIIEERCPSVKTTLYGSTNPVHYF